MSSSLTEQLGIRLEWQTAATHAPPRLADNEIHLWYVPLVLSTCDGDQAIGLLNDIQRDKYQRRATPQLRRSYLASRFHLLTLLGAYSKVATEEVQLSYGRLNKPYLNPNPQNIEFNCTDTANDSDGVGLFAFSKANALGVDIEALTRRSNFAAIVARRFSSAETDYVTESNGSINPHRFLAYWTRKEAYGKASGKGINFSMRDMDLASPDSFELNFHSDDRPSLPFRLQQIEIDRDFIASVAHAGHHPLAIKAFRLANQIP